MNCSICVILFACVSSQLTAGVTAETGKVKRNCCLCCSGASNRERSRKEQVDLVQEISLLLL